MWCDGQSFLVSRSVHDAIRALYALGQSSSATEPLWVDAICINQADKSEKTLQVRNMTMVYEQATNVFAWLGPESEAEGRAVDLLQDVWRVLGFAGAPNPTPIPNSVQNFQHVTMANYPSLGLPAIDSSIWEDVLDFCEKPWFSRAWIIQETLKARCFAFVSGRRLVNPMAILYPVGSMIVSDYFSCLLFTRRLETQGAHNIKVLATWWIKLIKGDLPRFTSCEQMAHVSNFGASDPRDKVFCAILLDPDADRKHIDYSQTLEETLLGAAALLLGTEGVEMLRWSRAFVNNVGVPSWVPVWTSIREPLCM